MARTTKSIDKRLATRNSFRRCLDFEIRNRGAAGMLLEHPCDQERAHGRHCDGEYGREPQTAPFQKAVLPRQPRKPNQVSSAAIAINAIRQMIFCMLAPQ